MKPLVVLKGSLEIVAGKPGTIELPGPLYTQPASLVSLVPGLCHTSIAAHPPRIVAVLAGLLSVHLFSSSERMPGSSVSVPAHSLCLKDQGLEWGWERQAPAQVANAPCFPVPQIVTHTVLGMNGLRAS